MTPDPDARLMPTRAKKGAGFPDDSWVAAFRLNEAAWVFVTRRKRAPTNWRRAEAAADDPLAAPAAAAGAAWLPPAGRSNAAGGLFTGRKGSGALAQTPPLQRRTLLTRVKASERTVDIGKGKCPAPHHQNSVRRSKDSGRTDTHSELPTIQL